MTEPLAALVLRDRPATLRVRPVPRLDGPYDDERPEPITPMVDGSLALAFPPPTRVSMPLRLVPPAGGVCVTAEPTRRDLLPDPRPWTARLAQAIVEVLAGARPAGQLSRVATLEVLQLLERGAGRLGARPGSPPQRPVVGSVHLSEPRDGIAEACAVVSSGPASAPWPFDSKAWTASGDALPCRSADPVARPLDVHEPSVAVRT